jgi:pyrophosphatase PpaX
LYDGIEDLLKDIRGEFNNVEYAALSNACGGYVRAVLSVNALSDMFSLALGADDVPAAKPQPDGLNQIVETLKLDQNRCIYVGDSPTDGQAATAAGMLSIGVTWGSHAVEKVTANFTYTVHSVDDLHNILKQLLKNFAARS